LAIESRKKDEIDRMIDSMREQKRREENRRATIRSKEYELKRIEDMKNKNKLLLKNKQNSDSPYFPSYDSSGRLVELQPLNNLPNIIQNVQKKEGKIRAKPSDNSSEEKKIKKNYKRKAASNINKNIRIEDNKIIYYLPSGRVYDSIEPSILYFFVIDVYFRLWCFFCGSWQTS